jgi:hypothetical protein
MPRLPPVMIAILFFAALSVSFSMNAPSNPQMR